MITGFMNWKWVMQPLVGWGVASRRLELHAFWLLLWGVLLVSSQMCPSLSDESMSLISLIQVNISEIWMVHIYAVQIGSYLASRDIQAEDRASICEV